MRKRTLKKCESCLRCGDHLNDATHSNRSRPNPLRKTSTWCICKSCLQKAKRATRDREKAREYSQQFAVENWHRTLANACARRARDAGLACEINHEAVSEMFEAQEGRCYWFDIPLTPSRKKKHLAQPSIDRLDSDVGYTRENCVLACYFANIGRRNTAVEVWISSVEKLRKSLRARYG